MYMYGMLNNDKLAFQKFIMRCSPYNIMSNCNRKQCTKDQGHKIIISYKKANI